MSAEKSTFQRVRFEDGVELEFLGRNGYFKCGGVEIWARRRVGVAEMPESRAARDVLRLAPLTSRGKAGRSFIEMPVGEIAALIEAMRAAVASLDDEQQTPQG